MRCRVSIYYLESALQGGIKKASRWLGEAHKTLSGLYQKQTRQYKEMGTL